MVAGGTGLEFEHDQLDVRGAVLDLLASKHIGAAFQPIWDLAARRVFGVEGLARPGGGHRLRGPRDAFRGAARLGLVAELDALCRQAVFAAAGELPHDVLLFVNLSPEVVGVRSFGRRLLREVENAGLTPDRVVIEVVEAAFAPMEPVEAPVRELRDLGFRLALDRAGSTRCPTVVFAVAPEFIKVDPDVVASAGRGEQRRAAWDAIKAYTAQGDRVVIAQKVETPAMLRAVMGDRAELPCAQGYLLGRPSLEPPWRSTTSARWPLRRISMGPELEAAALPSQCWCRFDGGHQAEPGITTSGRQDAVHAAGR
ncbi:MAG: EAL domain-containing protein [Cellulomonas sp.]